MFISRLPVTTALVLWSLFQFAASAPGSGMRRLRVEPVLASSAEDVALRARIAGLAPTIDMREAAQVARTAYTTGRELRRKWQVTGMPGYHNYLVNTGARKGGLCFQWATELLGRLHALNLRTIELHWVESYPGTGSEHNVIVVTAKGQPFWQGILLDNWRYGGRLAWGLVHADPHYEWNENAGELARRLPREGPRGGSNQAKRRVGPLPRVKG